MVPVRLQRDPDAERSKPRVFNRAERAQALQDLTEIPPRVLSLGDNFVRHYLARKVQLHYNDQPESPRDIMRWAREELKRMEVRTKAKEAA